MFRFANKMLLLAFVFVLTGRAHEQLLLVVAEDMNRSSALMQRYDHTQKGWKRTGPAVPVNLGRNGLGWGIGVVPLKHAVSDPIKHEGDGRAPAGIFALGPVFGAHPSAQTAMPYLQATGDLICIDDRRSSGYNRIAAITPELTFRSFEWMRREDGLYALGVVVQHNAAAVPGRGSCIFLHIERGPGEGTAGCTSMNAEALAEIIRWLDPSKAPLLIQIPQKSLPSVQQRFKGTGE
jgi:L,D-peptidoglycan transpeptidase YkuD (ErfK/YbiS/YcfS/YnhG family)